MYLEGLSECMKSYCMTGAESVFRQFAEGLMCQTVEENVDMR